MTFYRAIDAVVGRPSVRPFVRPSVRDVDIPWPYVLVSSKVIN